MCRPKPRRAAAIATHSIPGNFYSFYLEMVGHHRHLMQDQMSSLVSISRVQATHSILYHPHHSVRSLCTSQDTILATVYVRDETPFWYCLKRRGSSRSSRPGTMGSCFSAASKTSPSLSRSSACKNKNQSLRKQDGRLQKHSFTCMRGDPVVADSTTLESIQWVEQISQADIK